MNDFLKLPQGVKDFDPIRAEELRRVEDVLLEEFARWGYKRVITPLFEYLDSITIGLGEELKSKVMKFVDPSTGDIVALRPDITPQIGRIVATQLKDFNTPLRLCYSGRVVRFEEKGSGKEREVFQAGCELIGADYAEADAEIMALSVKSLEKVGIKNVVLDIGHTGILKILFNKIKKGKDALRSALKKKDQEKIEDIINGSDLDNEFKELFFNICNFYGDRNILQNVKKIEILTDYVEEIEHIIRILDEYQINCNLSIDLSDIRGFNYYTGITYEIISPEAFNPLVIGGRYDGLVGQYGYNAPATGFAIDMETVLSITKTHLEDTQVHFIVIPEKIELRPDAIKLTQWLRSSGFKVILDLNKDTKVKGRKTSKRTLTTYGVIHLESPTKLKLIESRSGVSREFSNLEDLLKGGN